MKSSMMGFAGLDRAEINLSYLNYRDEFAELTDLDDIRWAIEYLDESLMEYYNSKKEK